MPGEGGTAWEVVRFRLQKEPTVFIEHIALNVRHSASMAEWYERHLGMRVVRAFGPPDHGRFLADAAGRTVLELYSKPEVPVPDYAALHPMTWHVAFAVPDVPDVRRRLLAAGATVVGEVDTTKGDVLAMLRDPWGVCLQLVQRKEKLL